MFDFVDVTGQGAEVAPGSYNLVSQVGALAAIVVHVCFSLECCLPCMCSYLHPTAARRLQFPRRVFEDGGTTTLAEADLAHKQEALFIELKS